METSDRMMEVENMSESADLSVRVNEILESIRARPTSTLIREREVRTRNKTYLIRDRYEVDGTLTVLSIREFNGGLSKYNAVSKCTGQKMKRRARDVMRECGQPEFSSN